MAKEQHDRECCIVGCDERADPTSVTLKLVDQEDEMGRFIWVEADIDLCPDHSEVWSD